MRNFLLFIVALGVFFGCSSSDYKLKGRNEGGKVVIAPVDAGGTEKIMIEYNPNTNEVSIPAGNKLKVDVIEANSGGQPEGGVPAGTIVAFGGSSVPDGWFLCDGSEKSESTYAALFSAISTAWNTATNPTTGAQYSAPSGGNFRLPDLRGVFLRSVGDPHVGGAVTLSNFQNDSTAKNGLSTSSSSVSGGTWTASCTANQSGHYHQPTNTAKNFLVGYNVASVGNGGTIVAGGISSAENPDRTNTVDPAISCSASASRATNSTAAAQSITGDIETRPINVAVNYIIKY